MNYLMVALCGAVSFALQLLATKSLLPSHGGSASVWIGSLLFFQGFLFLSYLISFKYIKGSSSKINKVALVSLIINYLGLTNNWNIESSYFLISLIMTLTVQYGLIYISLLLISPFLQNQAEGNFFKYYVSSNGGAFLGLFLYPLIIEPNIGLTFQKYGLIGLSIIVFLWFRLVQTEDKPTKVLPVKDNVKYIIFLAGLGTFLLSSFSSYLIQDVVSFPLLWVIPLAIFLLSYMWAFSQKPLGFNFLNTYQIEVLEIISLFLLTGYKLDSIWMNMILNLFLFGVIIFIVQANLKNKFIGTKEESTHFYFLTALGGMIGGMIVNLIIPFLFVDINEYVFIVIFFLAVVGFHNKVSKTKYVSLSVILFIFIVSNIYKSTFILDATRGFYGLIRVAEISDQRVMYHGNIVHGKEELKSLGKPTTYYQPLMVSHYFQNKPKNIAIVGLGAGVLLHYIQDSSQTVDIYEIDEHVIEMAQKYFSFIKNTKAQINFIVGDGRKKLQESKTQYDLIIIDAFSGDSIPSHLLTYEALDLYHHRLKDQGIMGIHISNNYVDLAPIVKNTGNRVGFAVEVKTVLDNTGSATWSTLVKQPKIINKEYIWTDDSNSLLKIIK